MSIHQRVSTNIYRSEHFDTGPRLMSLVYVQIRSCIYIYHELMLSVAIWHDDEGGSFTIKMEGGHN